jgi:hypothetical protein
MVEAFTDLNLTDTVTISGTTPTLTIGDAGEEDTKIVFDGNAQDFYIGLDDSADDLVIGKGSAVGTTPAIEIDENLDIKFAESIGVGQAASSTTGDIVAQTMSLLGTTPTLTLGDGGEEDVAIKFNGVKDFYIANDDSADKLVIGEGSTVGSNNILTITDDSVTIGDGAAVDTKIVFDGNAQDYYIGLDDSADDLVIGKGSAVGTTPAISVDENQKVTFTKDIEVQADSVSGSEGGHITLRAASGGSKEFGIDVDSSNNLRIITEDDGTGDNGAAHVYVTNTGNVGIGTSSTAHLLELVRSSTDFGPTLEINNTSSANGSVSSVRYVTENETTGLVIGKHSNGFTGGADLAFINQELNSDLTIFTNNTERMRIDSSGRLLIGLTSAARTNDLLQVNGAEGINAKATANGGACFVGLESAGNTAGATFAALNTSASVVFKVAVGGAISSTNTSITSISDERAKENIRDLEIGLNEIKQLKPRRFDWKEGKGSQTKDTMGFIAQEVEQVNGFETLIDKWDDPDIKNAKALKMGDMLPALVKAIQEQQEQIEALQSEINTLKGG